MEPKISSYERGDAPVFTHTQESANTINAQHERLDTVYGEREDKVESNVSTSDVVDRSVDLPTPQVASPVSAPLPPAPVNDDGLPIVAGDDDLIEQAWVASAKKIIAETKDDPYKREQEVVKLQADYLRKRYGREVGEPRI